MAGGRIAIVSCGSFRAYLEKLKAEGFPEGVETRRYSPAKLFGFTVEGGGLPGRCGGHPHRTLPEGEAGESGAAAGVKD